MPELPLTAEARFKLELMRVINDDLERRFRTLAEAADYADVTWMRLSRMRSGRHEYFSVNWLFRLAASAGVHIRISVDPVNR